MTLPCIVRAEHAGEFRIHLVFNDGTAGTVDFQPWLTGPVFEPLKDAAYFPRFFLDGGTVVWPNGADIAPETLHAAAQQTRSISAADGAREDAPGLSASR